MYGAKLDTASVVAGLTNWRLQLLVFGTTYLVFPLVGLGLSWSLAPWIDPSIALGILFLAVLPSTVQSSIAFTSMAQGNVPAAVCAASLSNLVGVVVTPALAALLLSTSGMGIRLDAVFGIAVQILLPFVVGQLLRRWIGAWIVRHKKVTLFVDRGSILLIVYSAFSAGMVAGIWQQVSGTTLILLVAADIVLLAVIIGASILTSRAARLTHADSMVMLFCGSTKSLASGLPIANILFVGQSISLIVLPLMLFHQLQLFVCAVLAQRQAHRLTTMQVA
ncbi:bile acid:sodium symporter family protein [Devosia sp. YR412]|uniref:bile acid:sodium symporter family protein n=1 Tax=Devosia sp. YR412 TaxID=1881030 RepID=UPI001FCD6D0A|nr:bile acid:sodium symporter family protein [Devosia sp. YR412]